MTSTKSSGRNAHRYVLVASIILSVSGSPADAAVPAETVPTFRLRGRAHSVTGHPPTEAHAFTFALGKPGGKVTAQGADWSEWVAFTTNHAITAVGPHSYPNCYMKSFPVVTRISVGGVKAMTDIELDVTFDENDVTEALRAKLYGPSLGILLWRGQDGSPRAATMAAYNRRYWEALANVRLTADERPQKFPIVDRFIRGDNDLIALSEGVAALARGGFSAIMLNPTAREREQLLTNGLTRTTWAVYNPPGYAFDFADGVTSAAITNWAHGLAAPFLKAGYAREDMALYTISDEPGWYYPQQFDALKGSDESLARFRAYIEAQGLTPADVGAEAWDTVLPLGRADAVDLPTKRLFYWTARFFAHDSSRHFANSTRGMEAAFYSNMPIVVNWNNFSGRFYVPGPIANNRAKTDPNAGMGTHDWLEFGRMRGCTMLWTEDWFGDGQAYQWSWYCTRLRCAARLGGVEFGSYVIPRTAGSRQDGIIQKILAIVGSGGKALKYFVFGPEYVFPGNCYSENIKVLPQMAEAHRMIGAAESVLWPGRMPQPEVALLMPRSAQPWDAAHVNVPTMIMDVTNTDLNRKTVDYMAEVFDLYLALQHANVPADVVDEDDLSAEGLAPYKVLYVTEPNVPVEGQAGLAAWVASGGVLVTVSGAASHDRYNEPCSILTTALGLVEEPRERILIRQVRKLADVAKGAGSAGDFAVVGARSTLESYEGNVLACFDDGDNAIVKTRVGRGWSFHFAWLPGISYFKSSTVTRGQLPTGWSESIRDLILMPVRDAGVKPPVRVSQPLVEAPLLVSGAGAAVTLLNWTGQDIAELKVVIRPGFAPARVRSVLRGKIAFKTEGEETSLVVPLEAADVLVLEIREMDVRGSREPR